MSFLSMSGLKKVYESLGEEITRSFDSSQIEAEAGSSGPLGTDEKSSEKDMVNAPLSSEPSTGGEGDGENWGQWEEQDRRVRTTASTKTTAVVTSSKCPPNTTKSSPTVGSTNADMHSEGPADISESRSSTYPQGGGKREMSPAQFSLGSLPVSSDGGPLATSTPAKSGGKLDSLPRSELVKYIKKQAQLLQKSKARCDELSKECNQLKKSSQTPQQSSSGSEALVEELQVVRSERDKTVGEQRTLQQTITGLEQDKQRLDDQVMSLERVVQRLQSQEDDWKCRVEVASSQLAAQQQQQLVVKHELEFQLASVRQELAGARAREEGRKGEGERLRELQREVEVLKGRLEGAERERETARGEAETARREAETARGEAETVRGQMERVTREVERMRGEVERVRGEVERVRGEAREEVESERKEIEKMRAEKVRLEEELSRVRVELGEASEMSEEERGEMENLRTQLSELQDQLAAVSEDREQLQNELAVSRVGLETARREGESGRTEIERMKVEVLSLQSEHDRLQEQLGTLQTEQSDLQAERDSLQQERDSLLTEQEELHRDRNALQTAKELLQTECDSLKSSLQMEKDSLLSEREEMLIEKAALEMKVESLSEQVRQAEQQVTETELTEGGATGDESAVHSRVEELEREIQILESKLSSANTENERIRSSSDTAMAEHQAVNAELEALQEQLQDRAAEIVSLKSELETGTCKLEGLERECDVLRARKGEEAGEQGREVQQLRDEVSDLQRGWQEAEKNLEEAREEIEQAVKKEQEATQQKLSQQASAHRDETKKLKAYIVKIKKELADARGKAAAPSEEREDLQRQLEASVEAGQQSAAESEGRRVQAEETLQSVREELGGLHSERESLQSSLAATTEELSTLRSELSTAQSDLATFQMQASSAQRVVETAEREAGSLREELAREREGHSTTKQKLTAALKEAKANSVMNLELADYQRSLQALEERLSASHVELEQAREEGCKQQEKMDTLRKEIDLQTQQCIAVEDRLSKTKALWMKTKKELDSSRKAEGELQAAMVSLNAQLEGEKQLAEENKAEMSTLTAKLQSMQQQSDSSVGVLQKTVRSLEHKLAAAQNELTSSQLALSQCQQDYNSYKVRVHSVLKQKSSGPSPAEISTEIRQKFEMEISQLRAELQDNKSQLSSALAELEELSDEHHQLTTTHNQLLHDSQEQVTTAKKRLGEAESRHNLESREQIEVIGQLRQEVVEVTEAFRSQLHSLQEEHQRVVASLREDLDISRNTAARLQQDADARVLARASNQPDHSSDHTHSGQLTSHELKIPESLPSEQRGSGEGMDQSELDSNPQTPLSREDSQLSFERLLSTADSEAPINPASLNKPRGSNSNVGGGVSESQFRKELAKARKTIRGLNELLRDSEEATVRLGEQAKLLKEEIRRLERNREREEGVSNMEYLKNVVLKFMHSEDAAEQTALVPVVTQLLRLSPQEMRFLQDTIKGTPAALPDASSSLPSPSAHKGLAGYIHRWTGY